MNRKILAKWKVGSHLYGLNRPESDEDFMGVFMPKSEDLLGLMKMEEIDNSTKSFKEDRRNTSEDIDEKLYSLKKFLHLVIQNNPNIVEVLFATPESTLIMTPAFQELIDNRDKIISQKVYYTFTGYAYSQKKKLMIKKERYTSLNEGIEFLENKFCDQFGNKYPITEEDSVLLNKTLKYYKGRKNNTESFHKGMNMDMIISQLIRERDQYGWRVKTESFEKLGFDLKFGYHLIRIMAEGEQLLRTGKLEYPIGGEAREDIINVREGNVSYDELLLMYEKYNNKCEVAYKNTILPKKPDWKWANDWLIRTLKKSIIDGNLN